MMGNSKKPIYFGKDLEAMSFAKNYHQWIFTEIKQYLGRRVAEVGAGTGSFSELLRENVKQLIVFEPSQNMYPFLKARFASTTIVKAINNKFSREYSKFERYFDSIIYINVLEHIENDKQELSYVYKTLNRGGYAILFVPALSFLYSDLDKTLCHFRRYNKINAIKLAQQAGFKIKKAKYFDLSGIIPWYVAFVLLKRQFTGRKISLYDTLVVPLMRKIEKIIVPPIGKNLLLVLQKT